MQLRLDAADRLVELVEERRGPVYAEEAARGASSPCGTRPSGSPAACSTRSSEKTRGWPGEAIRSGSPILRAPNSCSSSDVRRRRSRDDRPSPGTRASARSAPCASASSSSRRSSRLLVDPGRPARAGDQRPDGTARRGAARPAPPGIAVRPFLEFAGDAVLVAHNARFDLVVPRPRDGAADRRAARRASGGHGRPRTPPARRAHAARGPRLARAVLRNRRAALPPCASRCAGDGGDPSAAARTCAGTRRTHRGGPCRLAAPRVRKVYAKRVLAFGAPASPGVYLFRDRHDQVLYVGRARDLRARLRSYFRSDRQRPAVEAALFALERIEWRPPAPRSKRRSRSCGSYASCAPSPTRATRGRIATCT